MPLAVRLMNAISQLVLKQMMAKTVFHSQWFFGQKKYVVFANLVPSNDRDRKSGFNFWFYASEFAGNRSHLDYSFDYGLARRLPFRP
jgi:hypothetical protein